MTPSVIYLDNAATTPLLPEVYECMLPYLKDYFGNPSSIYSLGRYNKMRIEEVRTLIAEELKCTRGEIIFTSSGTESINKAILSSIFDLQCTHIITSAIEHHATLHCIEYVEKKWGVRVSFVATKPHTGSLDYEHLEALLQEHTKERVLVSLLHANNEIGTLTDITLVSELCTRYQACLHLDTVQTIGHYPIDLSGTKVDFLSCSAHKFHGPKGVGFMYINASRRISPLLWGGGQERNMRAGTENIAGIVGLGKAFELAYKHLEQHRAFIQHLKTYTYEALQKAFGGNLVVYGELEEKKSLYTVLNIGFEPTPQAEMLPLSLDLEGVCVSSGSACSSGSEYKSHVIKAIQGNLPHHPVRFSFSHLNTKQEIDTLVPLLQGLLT